MTKTLWKFMRTGLKSNSGNCTWEIGQWKKHEGEITMCESGFHASTRILDALSYVKGEIISEVEVRGAHQEQADKQVWLEMKILHAYKWTVIDSVALAIYAAELVLPYFEKKYPKDDRPRKAIEAAIAYQKNPTKKAADAAYAAYAAAVAADAAAVAAEKINAKIERWLQKHVKELTEITK